jgi:hypothetical protein
MSRQYRIIETHVDNAAWLKIRMKAYFLTAHCLWRRLLGLTLCAVSVFLMRTINEVMASPPIGDISESQIARLVGALAVGCLGVTLFARCKRT